MNHNDLPAFSGKCEDVVIDPPHSDRGCRLRPPPRSRNRRPDPVGTLRGCRSPVAVPRAPCTRWISTASRPTPPRAATIDGAPCRTGRHCAGRLRQVH
ncbi:hypothetical protein G6F65_014977 [Rhizopus arrhizus]|nr:hypothetical protein G6F65_014977 [Rhizopus arrhizus]